MQINVTSSKEVKLANLIKIISLLRRDTLLPSDADYLAAFLCLPDKYYYAPFSSPARSKVAQKMKTTRQSVNNHIYALLKAGYLKRDTDGVIEYSKSVKSLRNAPSTLTINFNEEEESPRTVPSGS